MTTFSEHLAQAQANPHDADYHALRMAYTRTDWYAPYSQDAQTIQALHHALKSQDADAAIEAIDNLLAWNALDIEAHMAADFVYLQLGEHDKSNYHRAFAKGLIDAILATRTEFLPADEIRGDLQRLAIIVDKTAGTVEAEPKWYITSVLMYHFGSASTVPASRIEHL